MIRRNIEHFLKKHISDIFTDMGGTCKIQILKKPEGTGGTTRQALDTSCTWCRKEKVIKNSLSIWIKC